MAVKKSRNLRAKMTTMVSCCPLESLYFTSSFLLTTGTREKWPVSSFLSKGRRDLGSSSWIHAYLLFKKRSGESFHPQLKWLWIYLDNCFLTGRSEPRVTPWLFLNLGGPRILGHGNGPLMASASKLKIWASFLIFLNAPEHGRCSAISVDPSLPVPCV